jgi:hypothetical protein
MSPIWRRHLSGFLPLAELEVDGVTFAQIEAIDTLQKGPPARASLQQALTTTDPRAIRCQPSAASREGSQLAPEGSAP